MGPSDLLDPRVALVSGGVAAAASPRVRHMVGAGLGYGVVGARKVADAVVGTGLDIYGSAREVADHNGTPKKAARKRA
jgi:hypothetical protein